MIWHYKSTLVAFIESTFLADATSSNINSSPTAMSCLLSDLIKMAEFFYPKTGCKERH